MQKTTKNKNSPKSFFHWKNVFARLCFIVQMNIFLQHKAYLWKGTAPHAVFSEVTVALSTWSWWWLKYVVIIRNQIVMFFKHLCWKHKELCNLNEMFKNHFAFSLDKADDISKKSIDTTVLHISVSVYFCPSCCSLLYWFDKFVLPRPKRSYNKPNLFLFFLFLCLFYYVLCRNQ